MDQAAAVAESGRPVLVDVAIDYSRKTFFTRGVVKTNLLRLPFRDQIEVRGAGGETEPDEGSATHH